MLVGMHENGQFSDRDPGYYLSPFEYEHVILRSVCNFVTLYYQFYHIL